MERILGIGLGFWESRTLLSAVELGVFTTLGDRRLTAEELRGELGLHPRAARDFFDALVAMEILRREDGRYANTADTATYLDRNRGEYLGSFLEMAGARLYGFWGNLTEALRTGQPQNEARQGGDFFAALYEDLDRLRDFQRAMTGLSLPSAHVIAARFPWQRWITVADIGTAQGALLRAVLQEHPHLQGIGYDLPAVEPLFTEYVAPLGKRVAFQPGDFLTDPLPVAEVLVFGHILHDWDLDTKRMLLAKAHRALPEGGAILIYETLIDDERRSNLAGLLMSLNMLIETPGGFDYTAADLREWLAEAGFRDPRTERLAGPESMVWALK
ncbi:methyltransferase [Nocardia sp. 2]|uniref:Methyltransferase n=1 Tax=Nocardia acididurans TaxID=2802282 RepID=A0ABS1M2L8_9NOCA|nr:methyltransferase [Nocardia acididurans]MBL1074912.1 methyltransferase [Nocardia acididurans]